MSTVMNGVLDGVFDGVLSLRRRCDARFRMLTAGGEAVKPERQVYLIKIWRDHDNRLRVELRAPGEGRPIHFNSVSELAAFFEAHNSPRTLTPSGLR